MFTCPRYILIVTAPNWSNIFNYDKTRMAWGGAGGDLGSSWHSRQILGAQGSAFMDASGGSIIQSMSKQPPARQYLT